MTNITKLPEKWRDKRDSMDYTDAGWFACADELGEALPKWTKYDPDNTTTAPPVGGYVVVCHRAWGGVPDIVHALQVAPDEYWRPLIPGLDTVEVGDE